MYAGMFRSHLDVKIVSDIHGIFFIKIHIRNFGVFDSNESSGLFLLTCV